MKPDERIKHLPRWWPFKGRSFIWHWPFIGCCIYLSWEDKDSVTCIAHEKKHCEQIKRYKLRMIGFLFHYIFSPAKRFTLEAEAFAAAIVAYVELGGVLDTIVLHYSGSLAHKYWFFGRYSFADCRREILRYYNES